jgi:hypothetical protein
MAVVSFYIACPCKMGSRKPIRLPNRISGHVHSFYVDDGPFPFFLFAPVWVEVLLFLGGLVMIILSIAAPIAIIYYALKRISRNRYSKINAEIAVTWNNLRAIIAGWKDCPVALEYSHPQWINAIYNTIDSGRADTVKEAIQLLEDDERHRLLISAQAEAQKVFLKDQKRKQRIKEAEDEFDLLLFLSETSL